MKKLFFCIIGVLLALSLSGCVTVRKVVKERVDQDVTGNKGYLQGDAGYGVSSEKSKTREYIDVKVEVPTWREVFPKDGDEKSVSSSQRSEPADYNDTYEKRKANMEPAYAPEYEFEEVTEDEIYMKDEPVFQQKTYIIKEGDQLGKIAKQFYNKASKWTVIYEANRDKIKNPNKLKPGTEIIIPSLDESASDYIK